MLKYIVSCISTCISKCINYPDRYRNSLSWDTVPALLDVMLRYIHHIFKRIYFGFKPSRNLCKSNVSHHFASLQKASKKRAFTFTGISAQIWQTLKKNVQIYVTQLENDELKDSPVVEHAHEEGEEEDQGQHL
jgi:hypothetical protein